jgi:tetratricopeptide (TPR) repeat protein
MPEIAAGNSLAHERKSLKRPDQFVTAIREAFQKLAERPLVVLGVVVGVALVLAGVFFYLSYREDRLVMARNAYYLAAKKAEDELKAIVPPTPAKAKKDAPAAEDQAGAELEKAALKDLDVDKVFAGSIVELKSVVVAFQGTRPAFDSLLKLGSLYYDHGKPKDAVHWYGLAVEGAPGELDRALALQSLAAAHENAGQPEEAIRKLEESLSYPDFGSRGDALLALARNYEITKNVEKARSTYDRIVSEFPDSAQARVAESYRGLLK